MTDTLWNATEVLNAIGGELVNGNLWQASGFAMDSREVKKGDMFIALKGEAGTDKYRTSGQDGHNYVMSAFEKGAVAAIVDHQIDCEIPQIIVQDTFIAFQDLAKFSRNRAQLLQAIAVTGSVGKTGTRDMINMAFQGAMLKTHASIKSYNNMFGVPYTLATMMQATNIGIFEVGMNYAGEITPLSKIIHPTMAIITSIADVHTENFKDGIKGIVNAKSEIFNGMGIDGIAILPRDNKYYDALVTKAHEAGLTKIYSFGEHPESDARITEYSLSSESTSIKATILGEEVVYKLSIAGKHIAINSLSALLAVKLSEFDIQAAAKALEAIKPIEGRGSRELIKFDDAEHPLILIDESYNASPVALEAALRVLAMIQPVEGGRRIAILGDMLELGQHSVSLHKNIAPSLNEAKVDLLFACGINMKALYEITPPECQGAYSLTSAELADIIVNELKPGDVVLVKGSLGSKMKTIIDVIRAQSQ